VLRAAVKPIASLTRALASVDIKSKKPVKALVERSDICCVEPAAVVGEAAAALVIANAFLEKFGGDSVEEIAARID
jgi:chorismate synthase